MGGGVNIIDLIVPVGIVLNLTKDTDPNVIYPGTYWERIKGKVLVGVDENDSTFQSPGLTGGEKAHKLTLDEVAKHNHGFLGKSHTFLWGISSTSVHAPSAVVYAGGPPSNCLCSAQGIWDKTDDNATLQQSHNNLQPYQTVYMWERKS